ncbi:MAG: DUF2969 domain-containing protein [Vagococcus sp.]|nr:DUF2969 domain-containing protein [Vagococcus sp.]
MAKNKDIEVTINEKQVQTAGETHIHHELMIGKKVIGTIEEQGNQRFVAVINDQESFPVKSFDEGYEVVIRHWNLFQ